MRRLVRACCVRKRFKDPFRGLTSLFSRYFNWKQPCYVCFKVRNALAVLEYVYNERREIQCSKDIRDPIFRNRFITGNRKHINEPEWDGNVHPTRALSDDSD